MIRVQVTFSAELEQRLRDFARCRDLSVEEAIQLCVETALTEPAEDRGKLYARAARLVGAFKDPDGATDLSLEHDSYLSED